ncbi:probable Arginine permease [Saccharomycodes ludwigii]|uniref:Probable Arginine permease n=1 Tax=Saccharomycodes ludwigii TaxID=36035 RepID=A0A376B193_9ASCO|nr:hypothetical protein SCDLUD_003897 [Saccharomycodes ludwigii]KAH3899617.1 hypothetical protein SCDLUD_003897 [Saccharomycodes ludwigii]SSD58412.1 probable Arginine permease [Saccharomycodes ludwigii]
MSMDIEKDNPIHLKMDKSTKIKSYESGNNDIELETFNDNLNNQELNEENITGDYEEAELKRGLKARQVAMLALGGTIGTGLFISISQPLADAGPVNTLISYSFLGSLVYFVTQSLGEMCTFIPVSSSVTVFSQRFLSPAFGFANGWMYFWNWGITYAVEISVVGQIIQYWPRGQIVPLWAWILIFWVLVTSFNFFPVKVYGEIEFWLALIKVITIIGYLIFGLCVVCGASKQGPIGFRYWRNPGPWGPGIISKNKNTARFCGWVSSLVNASFSMQGVETVGVQAGEAANPRKTVPKAINKVFYRIILFYIGSIFFIGLLVPYNDPRLSSTTSYIASSPFVISIQEAGIKGLPSLFNAIVALTTISAANSNVYIGSRVIYSLSMNNCAPKIFKICNKLGTPYYSVIAASLLGLLGFLVVDANSNKAFNWLINISSLSGLIAWFFILLCHIRFMTVLKHRGISRDDLPFKAKLMPFGAYFAAFFIFIIIFIQGFTAFAPKFDVASFFTAYISLMLMGVIWIGAQIYYKCRFLTRIEDIDIDTGRREADDIIWEDEPPKTLWDKFWIIFA